MHRHSGLRFFCSDIILPYFTSNIICIEHAALAALSTTNVVQELADVDF